MPSGRILSTFIRRAARGQNHVAVVCHGLGERSNSAGKFAQQ
jgi:DNA-nicking Smr family endonuclease